VTQPIVAVVGATATGKSAVSLALAQLIDGGGEIINADSMQFYTSMDIGTAKLPLGDRQGVPHHQLDTLTVGEDASVAHFQESARADIDAIHARGRRAIVVGGSGLYLRALLDRFDFPGTDPALRARLEARAEAEGPGILHRELAELDPVAAAKIHPRNAKRIVRALEIIEIAGDYTSSLPRHEYIAPAVQIALELPYEVLDARIEARVDSMWEQGLVDEVRGLAERGLRESITARRAVGYAEVLHFLDGDLTEAEARELVKRNTRRLARKQDRWFRPDPRVTWVSGPRDGDDVDRVAREVLAIVTSQEGSASA
jgi:tRNA dimethylallyltransferase